MFWHKKMFFWISSFFWSSAVMVRVCSAKQLNSNNICFGAKVTFWISPFSGALHFMAEMGSRAARQFLMTDSICHSSLPCTVLEKVTLTTIQFRFHLHTKVDPMFQCVYISTPLKSCPYKSSATCAWSMARVAEKTRLNICANNKGADQPACPHRLISAFVVRCSSFFFEEEASHKLKWRTEWHLEFISFSQNLSFQGYSALW